MPLRVLNVGGNSKAIPLPPQYTEFEHVLLDIDPAGNPDVVCDARQLHTLNPAEYDAIYCSHNLEHYYAHEVPHVLAGFRHVLRDSGFVHIRVPDLQALMQTLSEKQLDLTDLLYQSPAGPLRLWMYCMVMARKSPPVVRIFSPTKLALRQHP